MSQEMANFRLSLEVLFTNIKLRKLYHAIKLRYLIIFSLTISVVFESILRFPCILMVDFSLKENGTKYAMDI